MYYLVISKKKMGSVIGAFRFIVMQNNVHKKLIMLQGGRWKVMPPDLPDGYEARHGS